MPDLTTVGDIDEDLQAQARLWIPDVMVLTNACRVAILAGEPQGDVFRGHADGP